MVVARLAFQQYLAPLVAARKVVVLGLVAAVAFYGGCRVGRATTPSGVLGRVVVRAAGGAGLPPGAKPPRAGEVPPLPQAAGLRGHRVPCLPVDVLAGGFPAPPAAEDRPGTANVAEAGVVSTGPGGLGAPGGAGGVRLEPLAGADLTASTAAPAADGRARLGLVGRLRAWAARRSAERAERRVEDVFPGQLNLTTDYLLAAGLLPPSDRPVAVGAKISKAGGKTTLIWAERPRDFLAVGGLRRAWLEFGPRGGTGGLPTEPEVGVGFMADGLRVWGTRLGAYSTVDRGLDSGRLTWQVKVIAALDFSPPK